MLGLTCLLLAEQRTCVKLVQKLLILGWGDTVLMVDLLSELDHGPSALPKGSQVTMLNTRTQQEVLGMSSLHPARVLLFA